LFIFGKFIIMKKRLILVRHATAEDQTMMIRDFQRELVGKGKTDALVMGKWLAGKDIVADIIVTSSAPRAFQTALILADQIKFATHSIIQKETLYDGGPRAYLSAINGIPEATGTAILVGHNPDITYFAEYLSGADIGSMSKCGVVILGFEDLNWNEISSKTVKFESYTTARQVREVL
jgi:phosphohistidine phosphatase